jgi:hypothetical protein
MRELERHIQMNAAKGGSLSAPVFDVQDIIEAYHVYAYEFGDTPIYLKCRKLAKVYGGNLTTDWRELSSNGLAIYLNILRKKENIEF